VIGYRVQAIPISGVLQNFSRKSKPAGDFGFGCVDPVFPFSPHPAVDVLLYYICVLGSALLCSALLAIMCGPAVDGLLYYPLVLTPRTHPPW
jgi:hypothetical protein